MARKRKGNPINAVVFLDKPQGMSSNGALQSVRRMLTAKKAGHTGSLDPMATGLLPICLGEATKFSQWGLDAHKHYSARVRLGVTTRSGDAEGEIIGNIDAQHIQAEQVVSSIEKFKGKTQQVPSMFSALKYKGTPLYELARKGVEVERAPRNIEVFKLDMSDFTQGEYVEFNIDVSCTKGTYVRTLAEDIGLNLGVGAHLIALRRTGLGGFSIDQAITLDQIQQWQDARQSEILHQHLQPVDTLIKHLPLLELSPEQTARFLQGMSVSSLEFAGILEKQRQNYDLAQKIVIVRVFSASGQFLGVANWSTLLGLQPKRILANTESMA